MNKSYLSLYLVTCNNNHKDFEYKIMSAIKAGITCIQLRDKALNSKQLLKIAYRLRRITSDNNLPLIINDDIELATAVDADGIHLGQQDMSWQTAREKLGINKIIGLSIENTTQAQQNQNAKVDYFGVGPIFPTSSKMNAPQPLGYQGLKAVTQVLNKKPCVAIGGIKQDNFRQVLKCDVAGIAIISSIMNSPDPYYATYSFRQAINEKP